MREILITNNEKGQRVDKFLMKYMALAPKSFIYKMLRKKNIKLNNKKAEGNEILNNNDVIKLFLADETIDKFIENKTIKKASRDFEIVYEDENIILANKPQRLIVHPDKEHKTNTLNDQLIYYLSEKGDYNPNNSMGFIPSICNRLDLNTSGIVTMGKNLPAVQELNRGFKEKLIDKYYITIVKGNVTKAGVVEGYHSKSSDNIAKLSNNSDEGNFIRTLYKPLAYNGEYTLLEIKLETGKSHQIRICMKSIGHPIIGDRKYGDTSVNKYFYDTFKLDNQFLHSYKLIMKFDSGCLKYLNNKVFKAKPSVKFDKIINNLFENVVEIF